MAPTRQKAIYLTKLDTSFYIVILLTLIQTIYTFDSDNYCPKGCTCDDGELQVTCNQHFGASSLPHTLNPSLTKLTTNYAKLSSFSGVDQLKDLRQLDVSHNKYTFINFKAFQKNHALTILNASFNVITFVNDSSVVDVLSSIKDDNQVERILSRFPFAKLSLLELYLSSNALTTLKNFCFIGLTHLRILDLSGNNLNNLEPKAFFGLNSLKILDLHSNRLHQVPTSSLQSSILSMNNAPILSSLENLDLSDNSIEHIFNEGFAHMSSLKDLNLDHNMLRSFDDRSLKSLVNLNSLSMIDNRIERIPRRALSELRNIKVIRMNSNPILYLEKNSFNHINSLESLSLSNTSIAEILKGSFSGLNNLKTLILNNNKQLKLVEEDSFLDFKSIMLIDLSNSSVTTLYNDFERIFNNFVINLSGNPLNCDCNLKWMTQYLKNLQDLAMNHHEYDNNKIIERENFPFINHLTDATNISCSGPPYFKGKLIINLPKGNLECIKPSSDVNLKIGLIVLYLFITVITVICTVSFLNKNQLLVVFKDTIIDKKGFRFIFSYKRSLHENCNNLARETQLYTIQNDLMRRNNELFQEDTLT